MSTPVHPSTIDHGAIEEAEKTGFCQFCKKLSPLKKDGTEILCSTCGFIVLEILNYTDSNIDSELTTHKLSTDQVLSTFQPDIDKQTQNYDIGLTTGMNPLHKDYSGRSFSSRTNLNLKRASIRARVSTTLERNRFKGYLEASRLCKALDIPEYIQKKAIETYIEFSTAKLLRNRNVHSCILSLLVIYCNRNNIPLSISEALKQTGVARKKFNKDYFYLYYLFEKAHPTGADVDAHLQKFCSYIYPDWVKLDQFKNQLEKLKAQRLFDFIEGREAIVVTGTITYYLLKHFGYPFLDRYLKQLVINRLTLKNKWLILKEKYKELNLQQYEET